MNAELHNIYGPTEATIGTTIWPCQQGQETLDVPIGRPISNSRIYILDRGPPTGANQESAATCTLRVLDSRVVTWRTPPGPRLRS